MVDYEDLVKNRFGYYCKKFTEVPFTGRVAKRHQGFMKGGEWDGPRVSYHENGLLWAKGTYKDGKRDGPWVSYHENGLLSEKGTYKDGNREGPWVTYFSDGTVMRNITGTYNNGMKVK